MVRCGMFTAPGTCPCGEQLGAAHVDQNEVGRGFQRFVHVAAIGLQGQPALEMGEGGRGFGKSRIGDKAHGGGPFGDGPFASMSQP